MLRASLTRRFIAIALAIVLAFPSSVSAQVPGIFQPVLAATPVFVPIGTPTAFAANAVANNSVTGVFTFATTSAITAGNLVCINSSVQDTATADAITSVTVGVDSLTNTNAGQPSSGGDMRGETWCKANATAQSSGVTVTVTYNGAIAFGVAVATWQVSGIISVAPVDAGATALGPGTAITNPTVTSGALAQANSLVMYFFDFSTSTPTPDAAFTTLHNFANGNGFAKLVVGWKIVAATTAVGAAPTQSGANFETLAITAFKGN